MELLSIHPRRFLLSLLLTFIGIIGASGQSYEWTTFAGSNGGLGFNDGPIGSARFKNPFAVATDSEGNIYLADTGNHTIRKISTVGMVSTVAGKGGVSGNIDGSGENARFNSPSGITVAGDGNIYVTDTGNHTIRKIDTTGQVTTIAGEAGVSGHVDGSSGESLFSSPIALTLSPSGDLFIADTGNHLIRKITPSGLTSTFAGQSGQPGAIDGGPPIARFNSPKSLATDDLGTLYIADSDNCLIRSITPDGIVSTIAGQALSFDNVDGIGTEARFYDPQGITVDAARNIYVSDPSFGTIRRISATDRMVITLAGDITATNVGRIDGIGTATLFNEPRGLALSGDGSVLVADSGNHALRKVTPAGVVTTFIVNPQKEAGAADGVGTAARFSIPFGLAVDGGGTLFIADTGNRTIRKISPSGLVTTFAGASGIQGTADGPGSNARFISPRAVAIGTDGIARVADVVSTRDSTIRLITPTGTVSTLAGTPNTLPYADSLYFLTGVAVNSSGNVFASDFTSIRKITTQGIVSVFAGQPRKVTVTGNTSLLFWNAKEADGIGTEAGLKEPSGVAIDTNDNLYVTETGGNTIRKVTPAAVVTTLAGKYEGTTAVLGSTDGTGPAARFKKPHGIAVDYQGNVYIADSDNHTIRKMSPAGVVTTIGGLPGYAGSGDGSGDRALFSQPYGIAVDSHGTLYVADTKNNRIVKGVPPLLPEIVVENAQGVHFSPGGPDLNFGSATPNIGYKQSSITIRNVGKSILQIQNVEISGADPAQFQIVNPGIQDSIPSNGSGVLNIRFIPTTEGPMHATLTITNNDPDEGTFSINLTGVGNSPPVLPPYFASAQSGGSIFISLVKLLSSATDPENDAISVTSVQTVSPFRGQIALLTDSIRYIAPTYLFTGTETFLVTITDARGGSSTGQVNVTVRQSTSNGQGGVDTNPPKLTLQADGAANVSFHGIPGRSYIIQRSLNLATWESIANITADATGQVLYIDPAPPLPSAYYRIAVP